MTEALHRWYVPDAYIPPRSTPPEESHESICLINPGDQPAEFVVTAYFADREPARSRVLRLAGRRSLHLRTDRIEGLAVDPGVPYGLAIECAADLQMQYSRLDTSQAAYTLMTTALTPVEAWPTPAV